MLFVKPDCTASIRNLGSMDLHGHLRVRGWISGGLWASKGKKIANLFSLASNWNSAFHSITIAGSKVIYDLLDSKNDC